MLTLGLFCLLVVSCRPTTYTPKPRGYARVELPQHEYQSFNEPGFPYSFEYPTYARIIKDTLFFGQKPENPYWINIDFPSIGGRIYISYKKIDREHTLDQLMEDTWEMSYTAHTKRADFIQDRPINNPNNVYGTLFNVGGNAASAYQFIATDSFRHFMRGALYFDVSPNADSLRPANEFLLQDMQHMFETLQWGEETR